MSVKSVHSLEEVLHPQSIAVVGVSSGPTGRGFSYVSPLIEHGYKGKIYPVNPKYSEILGLKTYPSLKEIPGTVDYVISALPASQVLRMLEDCPQKGVKCVHLYTARFSETGRRDAVELEQEVLRRAKQGGFRIIGPNCMGLYYPAQGISWGGNFPKDAGSVALASQSGSVAIQFIPLAASRGVRFSKVISYGNALDFNESDYLEYLTRDPETKVILMYIEGVKDGKRFLAALRQAVAVKPVLIMKGGRGEAGMRATASHTAALAGSMKIWEILVHQTGVVPVENLDEMLDLAVSFYFLPPVTGRRVGVVGGAGGPTVMAADQCEEAGLDVIPLPEEIREELKRAGNPIWDWIGNPADRSINLDVDSSAGDMLKLMARDKNFDLLIAMMNVPIRAGSQSAVSADKYLEQYQVDGRKPLLAVVEERSAGADGADGAVALKLMQDVKTKLVQSNIPFYPTIGRAASAASKLISYYQKRD